MAASWKIITWRWWYLSDIITTKQEFEKGCLSHKFVPLDELDCAYLYILESGVFFLAGNISSTQTLDHSWWRRVSCPLWYIHLFVKVKWVNLPLPLVMMKMMFSVLLYKARKPIKIPFQRTNLLFFWRWAASCQQTAQTMRRWRSSGSTTLISCWLSLRSNRWW